MRTNPAFLLAGAIAATIYFAPTKDPTAEPKDAHDVAKQDRILLLSENLK